MKITKSKLREIIREEIQVLNEVKGIGFKGGEKGDNISALIKVLKRFPSNSKVYFTDERGKETTFIYLEHDGDWVQFSLD